MTTKTPIILQIAVPAPLRRYFDYLLPDELADSAKNLQKGVRVRIPFKNKELIGIFIGFTDKSDVNIGKLKPILAILDTTPILTPEILNLCLWTSEYYHFPIGEVLSHALPGLLRQGKVTPAEAEEGILTGERLEAERILPSKGQGWQPGASSQYTSSASAGVLGSMLTLNCAQQHALDVIREKYQEFQVFLLDGITGSGKTEVYLQAITDILQQGKQALVLVPEIGLTPQTIQRFKDRFAVPVVALHSRLTEKKRLESWLAAREGQAKIVIGTRSAIFTPFANLGLIIVDEEHDLSFKQQEGLRYHARDLAIMRAHFKNIPIILGSATPALETLQKAQRGRYQHLRLPERAGNAQLPDFHLLDIRKTTLEQGLSLALIEKIKLHLASGNQVMLFLNRRGFAPVLMCHQCGWIVLCKRCDARMTFHQATNSLHCHHCDSRRQLPKQCEACGEKQLTPIGLGTERLELILEKYFPNYSVARIDRDSTQRKGKMEALLDEIQTGKHHILIGTQMLAKGHHFPNVTLVAIIDADGGFFSSDFRALERMGQVVLQVSGRAGRADKPGVVIIQTHHPEHPLLHQLIHENYQSFAQALLAEREQALLPPFRFFALFRAEAHMIEHATEFLQNIKTLAQPFLANSIQLSGPIPAPMPRRAGKHRLQLLIQANARPLLQQFLKTLIPEIEKTITNRRVRWSLDVDPMEMV